MGSPGWLPSQVWDGTEAGECAPLGESPPTNPASIRGERRGFLGAESQRKCDTWQETPRLERFSFCPDWWWISPNHLVRTPRTCVCVHLRSCRVAGSSPARWADAGQTSTDSERPSGGRAFRPDGFDFNSTALRPRARVPLHQASVSRSVTWAEELRSLLKSVGQSGNQVMYCTHKEEPFWTERLRKRKEICPGQ